MPGMSHLLFNVVCAASVAPIWFSFLLLDRLLRMESKFPEAQRQQGGRAVGILSMARESVDPYPQWGDIKAFLLGLRLYATWLFRMPLWIRNDLGARRKGTLL